jgi:hypothetical protein
VAEKIFAFGEKWVLQGDANTGHVHGIANGRKKKCTIFSLQHENRVISEEEELRKHIVEYYKKLFGREQSRGIHIGEEMWRERGGLSEDDAQDLIKPFTVEEIERALKDMGSSLASGPDCDSSCVCKLGL